MPLHPEGRPGKEGWVMRARLAVSLIGAISLLFWSQQAAPEVTPICCYSCSAIPDDALVGSFAAYSEAGGVHLLWYTVLEVRTASFDLSRSTSPTGPFVLVSGQIPRAGTDS